MMIYLICLVVGLVFTLVSVVFGHFFGGHGEHVGGSGGHAEAGADSSDMPGISIFSPTIIAAFITAFGGFGLIFSEFPLTQRYEVSAPLAAVSALAVAGMLYAFLGSVFRHTQGSSESHVARLAGDVTQIISQLPPIIESLTGIKFEKLLEQVPALKKAMGKDETGESK